MAITHHEEDILPHINPKGSVGEQAVAASGCVTVLGLIQVCWSISGDELNVNATLQTPFGNASLGSVTLSPEHATATLGGGIAGFKAEVTLTFDFSALTLQICGKACAPFAGCKSGCTTINV